MTVTNTFIKALRLNGYGEHVLPLKGERHRSFSRSTDRRYQSFTILGGGWVDVYQREYPAREGWARFKCRTKEAMGLIGYV